MIGKGKAVVGKAAALLKDEALGLIDDAREAKAPIKEGVSTFLKKKSVPLAPAKRAAEKLPNEAATETAGGERSTEREPPAQGNREYFRRLIEETNKRASSSSSGKASSGA